MKAVRAISEGVESGGVDENRGPEKGRGQLLGFSCRYLSCSSLTSEKPLPRYPQGPTGLASAWQRASGIVLGSSDVEVADRRSLCQIALWCPSMPPVLLSVTLPPKRHPSQLSTCSRCAFSSITPR